MTRANDKEMKANVGSNNRDARANDVGLAKCLNHERGIVGARAKGHKEHLIFVVFQQRMQFRFQLREAHFIERAFEDRVLQAHAEAFERASDSPQPFRIADVVADEVADARHSIGSTFKVQSSRGLELGPNLIAS
jgi:hypothetical protein